MQVLLVLSNPPLMSRLRAVSPCFLAVSQIDAS